MRQEYLVRIDGSDDVEVIEAYSVSEAAERGLSKLCGGFPDRPEVLVHVKDEDGTVRHVIVDIVFEPRFRARAGFRL